MNKNNFKFLLKILGCYKIRYYIYSMKRNNPIRQLQDETNPFAVFCVVHRSGLVAATTRAADRGEGDRIGLPGGKIDAGESPVEAAIREAREEGWKVGGRATLVASRMVEGRPVLWFEFETAEPLKVFKESHRGIRPIWVTVDEIANSGYGNDFLKNFF